jgi:hypothetical protein
MPVVGFEKRPRKYASDPRERARELVRDGKLGGARPGSGRPRKSTGKSQSNHPRPAAAAIAAFARDHADELAQVFADVLDDPDATDAQKLRAVRSMLGIEMKETEFQLEERKLNRPAPTPEHGSAEDAAAQLAARLAANPIVTRRLLAVLAPVEGPEGNPPKVG